MTHRTDEGLSGMPRVDSRPDYQPQCNESRMLLIRAHAELQLKNEQIQLIAKENADLLTIIRSEKESRQKIEVDPRPQAVDEPQAVDDRHGDRQLQQRVIVNHPPGYASSMMDLTKEVKRARDELQHVYFENSRYRSQIQKLMAVLEKADEQYDLERTEWRSKAAQLLKQVQAEEDQAKKSKAEADKLAADCIKIGADNIKFDQQLSHQEVKMRIILKELDDVNQANKDLSVEIKSVGTELNEKQKSLESTVSELTKTRNQLRIMSEKVFQLIGTLDSMQIYKSQAQDDLQAAAKKIAVLERRMDHLHKTLDKKERIRVQLETKLKSEKEKSSSFRLTSQEFRRKFIAEEMVKNKFMEMVKAKDKSTSDFTGRYKDAQWLLNSYKSTRNIREHNVEQLELQVRHLVITISDLNKKIQHLQEQQIRSSRAGYRRRPTPSS